MFSRKQKPADVVNSVNRFADVHRESFSRVKHLRILLETLSLQEKKQLLEEYSFETFHLVDELLLNCDISQSPQGAAEAESGLWTLEQLLCLAPELVGNGWQRHAIEAQLKKAIYPHNLLAVRKIAIRLFLIFYQSLAVQGQPLAELDRVFQSLLPFFPLRSGESTEVLLQEYCQSAGSTQWGAGRPAFSNTPASTARERAQLLQVYLDKFLEYCTRETMRIEWNDEEKRLSGASFILDRVITLYIHETFTDLEVNGVDIFGGWVGGEMDREPLDTADPLVIARYWLIRWMNNIASCTGQASAAQPGLLLFNRALFLSQRATNTLLSLMGEAMQLPLPCSNVMHKVVSLASCWLLHREVPPFVSSGAVSSDSSSLLLLHTLLSFFQSPYLSQPGERVSSAVSLAFSVLRTCRSLASSRHPLSSAVWGELMSRLADSSIRICSTSDALGQETAGALTGTLLTLLVSARALRGVEIEERIWDEVTTLLEKSVWMAAGQQWTKTLNATTRALCLHISHVDIFTREQLEKSQQVTATRRLRERAATDSCLGVEETSGDADPAEDCVFVDSDDISAAVTTWNGDTRVWLSTWRKLCLLLSPGASPSGTLAAQTLSQTAVTLFFCRLDCLGLWLVERLLHSPPPSLSQCVPALVGCLSSPLASPSLHSATLVALSRLLPSTDRLLLCHLCSLRPCHLSLLSPSLLSSLPRLPSQPSDELLSLLGQLALSHTAAESWLLRSLAGSDISLKQAALVTNALCMVCLVRGDCQLGSRLVSGVLAQRASARLVSLLSPSLLPLIHFGHSLPLIDMLISMASALKEDRARTEILSLLVSLCLSTTHSEMERVLSLLSKSDEPLLESAMITLNSQFPLPSFSVTQWNSPNPSPNTLSPLFIKRNDCLLSVHGKSGVQSRSLAGRHLWSLSPLPPPSHASSSRENAWLSRLAARPRPPPPAQPILGAMADPLEGLPRPPSRPSPLSTAPLLSLIQSSVRPLHRIPTPPPSRPPPSLCHLHEWRAMAVTMGYVDDVMRVPSTFCRNLRHLDQMTSRETHKVAVIYVPEGHEDKQSILSVTETSAAFSSFVGGLGWEVKVGRGHEGYAGGLPADSVAVYHAEADAEVIFHVSSRLGGDIAHKLKHIGNDEVHIVWNEHWRPYRRETIATSFCDVLLVLERAGPSCLRLRVQTRSELEFGPLWDGCLLPEEHAPALVRAAAVNASRAYRVARETERPVRHRLRGFREDMALTQQLPLAPSLAALYAPALPC